MKHKAELLLRAGTLDRLAWECETNCQALRRLQKILSVKVLRFLNRLGIADKVAEARVDLAICYWREGGLDEARVTLRLVLIV